MRAYTVWRFESATTGEVVFSVRPYHVDDLAYVHAYQRIIWRGLAASETAALMLAKAE